MTDTTDVITLDPSLRTTQNITASVTREVRHVNEIITVENPILSLRIDQLTMASVACEARPKVTTITIVSLDLSR